MNIHKLVSDKGLLEQLSSMLNLNNKSKRVTKQTKGQMKQNTRIMRKKYLHKK